MKFAFGGNQGIATSVIAQKYLLLRLLSFYKILLDYRKNKLFYLTIMVFCYPNYSDKSLSHLFYSSTLQKFLYCGVQKFL